MVLRDETSQRGVTDTEKEERHVLKVAQAICGV
jgi:hypothetical protein